MDEMLKALLGSVERAYYDYDGSGSSWISRMGLAQEMVGASLALWRTVTAAGPTPPTIPAELRQAASKAMGRLRYIQYYAARDPYHNLACPSLYAETVRSALRITTQTLAAVTGVDSPAASSCGGPTKSDGNIERPLKFALGVLSKAYDAYKIHYSDGFLWHARDLAGQAAGLWRTVTAAGPTPQPIPDELRQATVAAIDRIRWMREDMDKNFPRWPNGPVLYVETFCYALLLVERVLAAIIGAGSPAASSRRQKVGKNPS